jgi:hypothetical protein
MVGTTVLSKRLDKIEGAEMLRKEDCQKVIRNFRAKHGLDTMDENIIATIHLMNTHGLDVHAALDQSSRSGNDHGADAWYYNDSSNELHIYQSKLTESKAFTIRGLNDLDSARQWIEQIIIFGTVDSVPNENHCLFNLYTKLGMIRGSIKKIRFNLISLFDRNEIEDSSEYQEFEKELVKSKLNNHMHQVLGGKLLLDACEFNLEYSVASGIKVYPINKIPNARIDLRRKAHLDLAYISLDSLIQLYRQRGDVLFDKNVRLSLIGTKEARERLVHPMEDTLDSITSGKLSPNIFPFYHIGITISATSASNEDSSLLNLEAPSIINGCQTITIANEYLKRLERQKNDSAIDLFKQIKVIAKVVVGTTNEELKEITNSNNRQNPIENWQLFSNEPIHIDIEATLKDIGIFYERQKGKFDSLMKNADNAKYYSATNRTYVRIVDLAQIIALSRQNLQWAAKPSEIFLNKENHDKIFDKTILLNPRDIIFIFNLFKAIRRGLVNYLDIPSQANSNAPVIFNKPIVRAHVYYLTLLQFYQKENKWQLRYDFSRNLTKIASPTIVDETESFYQRIITKTRNWYTEESKSLIVEVSKRKLDEFFANLATEFGVETIDGATPFSDKAIDWKEYEHKD